MRPSIYFIVLAFMTPGVFTVSAKTKSNDIPNPCYAAAKQIFGRESAIVGENASAPTLLFKVEPELPEREPPIHGSGNWLASILISPEGDVNKLWIIREPKTEPPCADCADGFSKAILKWKYTPTVVNGTPAPLCIVVVGHINWR